MTDVSAIYGKGGLDDGDPRTVGTREPWVGRFVDAHVPEITRIMQRFADAPR